MSLNRCEFIGNLGRDPEVRTTQNGGKIVNLRIAVTEKWKDRNSGERRERTEWIPVAIFAEGLAKVAEQYLRKGSKVYIAGEFSTRKWQDQSGADRYSTEVVLRPYKGELVMLDAPKGDTPGDTPSPQGGGFPGLDSEIPF